MELTWGEQHSLAAAGNKGAVARGTRPKGTLLGRQAPTITQQQAREEGRARGLVPRGVKIASRRAALNSQLRGIRELVLAALTQGMKGRNAPNTHLAART